MLGPKNKYMVHGTWKPNGALYLGSRNSRPISINYSTTVQESEENRENFAMNDKWHFVTVSGETSRWPVTNSLFPHQGSRWFQPLQLTIGVATFLASSILQIARKLAILISDWSREFYRNWRLYINQPIAEHRSQGSHKENESPGLWAPGKIRPVALLIRTRGVCLVSFCEPFKTVEDRISTFSQR